LAILRKELGMKKGELPLLSHLPYSNKLIYHIQTKLQCEIPDELINDINYAIYDFGKNCCKVSESEKMYWREKALFDH
jgi:endonuclease III